jgi:DNA-binding CsgD family transcriptional regulator
VGGPRLTHRAPATDEIDQFPTDRSGADTTQASGQRGLALTVSGRVGRIVSECGARTPVTLAMVSPLALTRPEREIATLVSKRLFNKEVADATTMSVPTVEGHVHPACSKIEGCQQGRARASHVTDDISSPPLLPFQIGDRL